MTCGYPETSVKEPAGPAKRIVVIGPSTLKNLLRLGAINRVVGVSDFCDAKEAAGIPRVGGLLEPNLERIASLAPDLLLTQGKCELVQDWCKNWGIKHIAMSTDSIAGWRKEISSLQEILGLKLRPLPLAWPKPASGKLKTLVVVSRAPGNPSSILAAGPKSFLSEILTKAGGVNALEEGGGDAGQAYASIDGELLIALNPEVILDLAAAQGVDVLREWQSTYPGLAAVKTRRVHLIQHPGALLPGPEMDRIAQLMAQALGGH